MGNTAEDSIAPNECDFGRPSLAQIWDFLQKIEELPNIAWVRVSLHNDTEIAKYDGEEVLELWGDTIVVCTSVPEEELEELMKYQWLCSGGAEECDIADLDSLFSCRPPVQMGFVVLKLCGIDFDGYYFTYSVSSKRYLEHHLYDFAHSRVRHRFRRQSIRASRRVQR